MLEEADQVQSQFSPERELYQLEKLRTLAENHICYSTFYLHKTKKELPYRNTLKINADAREIFEEGFSYLKNAYYLVEAYKDCVFIVNSIGNEDIESVNDMLLDLEFDPKHIMSWNTVMAWQDTKYYQLLHSVSKNSFSNIFKLNIDLPIKNFLNSIKQRLQFILSEKLSKKSIENGNLLTVENCIREELLTNLKHKVGNTPLYCCVNNGNIDIVTYLLKKGAKPVEITINNETPLYIASSKGYREITEVLLQYINRYKLNDVIDAKTINGTTPLHVAVKNNFLEIVKSLLQHGAIYNIKNKEGKIPVDLSQDKKIIKLLKLIEELFGDIKNGNIEIISKLKAVEPAEFFAITNARNNQRETLLQVAKIYKRKNIVSNLKMLEILKKPDQEREEEKRRTPPMRSRLDSTIERFIVKKKGKSEKNEESNMEKALEELRKELEGMNKQQGKLMEQIKKLSVELVQVRKLMEDERITGRRRKWLKREGSKRERRKIRQELDWLNKEEGKERT